MRVQLIGGAALARKLRPELVREPAGRLIRAAAAFGAREAANAAGTHDLGAIARSITAEVRPLSARVVSRHPGALAVEFGRKVGTPPPPAAALRDWASRHGLAGAEFAIARAISRRGVKGRFFMRRARQKLVRYELPRLVAIAKREIADAWGRK